ncbi:N-acetylmuramoyl-L-alanine amidase [Alicyclobacillus suci]|uniref:N-acetylmuramoyl-L-alanine amidase n=1 Tax=Alicyclobacillus suci TaxID=2816080 RepID=UPI001F47804E|nr:N-acetylmuramoyl-L-alanine amidase [Alicyclobacillus suci]
MRGHKWQSGFAAWMSLACVVVSLIGWMSPQTASAASATGTSRTNEEIEGVTPLRPGLIGKVIVVDAGHGGKDSGARGVAGVHEKEITLAVAHRLTWYLQEAGATVVTTRMTDTDLASDEDERNRRRHLGDLRGRFEVTKRQKIDAFVSIHCNAAPSPAWHGAQVLYLKDNEHAKQLATVMQQTFQETLLPTKRSIQSNRTLYLLKRIDGPTVLAEIGFITNPNEAHWLQQPSYQDKVALAMYIALRRYYDGGQTTGRTSSSNDIVSPRG